MREYAVPVWITIDAESPQEAVIAVGNALCSNEFAWPEKLRVLCSCVGNSNEVIEEKD
jgi:hypothetical protein